MNRAQVIECINRMMNEEGIKSIGEIAFGLIQNHAEIIAEGNTFTEAMTLRDDFIHIQNAFDEEFNCLMGGEGNTYTAPE